MIIDSSYVNMASDRNYKSYVQKESITLEEREGSEIKLDLSAEGVSLMEQMKTHQEEKKQRLQEQQQKALSDQLALIQKQKDENSKVDASGQMRVSSSYEMKLEMLKKLLDAFRKSVKEGSKLNISQLPQFQREGVYGVYRGSISTGFSLDAEISAKHVGQIGSPSATVGNSTSMVRTTVTSAFETEVENTAYTAGGCVTTSDGRNISFGVSLEMSRAFCRKYETFSQQSYLKVDPLVINMDNESAKLTDVKFLFDLDADGKEEEVSFTDKGSGFLAYDKNGDGIINDGSELFGTRSGDGFRDLAAYDKDNNGWIDEADDIFKNLKVWTLDDKGEKTLIDLKTAGIGAIYLGNADTQFTLDNSSSTDKNGFIQKTGIYLHENGTAGTIQHVDLAL